jgi:hypothetical protein
MHKLLLREEQYSNKCNCGAPSGHTGGFVLATKKELIICNNCGKEMSIEGAIG